MKMNTTLNEQQQKYFLAAFSKYDTCEYSSQNKIKLFQFSDPCREIFKRQAAS